jgi:hypothetical protein
MTLYLLIVIIFGLAALLVLNKFGKKFMAPKRKLNQDYFLDRWGELLLRVRSPEGMILAVIDADKLLDEALKKKNFKGKTMGERLVSAQRSLTDNDAVWYAHKLRNRLVHEPDVKLKKNEAQKALTGFKVGLQDLGAF